MATRTRSTGVPSALEIGDQAFGVMVQTGRGVLRRYTRDQLCDTLRRGGFEIVDVRSWNVLLRPVVALRRRSSTGSDLEQLHPFVNAGLRAAWCGEFGNWFIGRCP